MTRDIIKFGIIGQGFIGKRHAEMIHRNSEAELVAICDILPKKQLGIESTKENFYNSANELIDNHPDIDAVIIAIPNGLHSEYALKVLEADKNVICEKPMALSKKDCEAVIQKALLRHKHIFCVMQNRYSPPSVWIKKVVNEKLLGDIFIVQLNCYWNRDERYYKKGGWKGTYNLDGGTLFTQFSHFIDTLYWLFGDIKNINARFEDFNHKNLTDFEDSGLVTFEFLNGGIGCINYSTSTWDSNLESSMTIVGKNGSVKIGGQYMNEVQYCNIKNYKLPELPPTNPANDYGAYKGSANNHGYVIQNVIDVLKGRDVIATSALEGMKVVDIIERIYQSST